MMHKAVLVLLTLESFTDAREHVPTVADSTMTAEITGPVILKNKHAYPVLPAHELL
jgi:hypothetical protein